MSLSVRSCLYPCLLVHGCACVHTHISLCVPVSLPAHACVRMQECICLCASTRARTSLHISGGACAYFCLRLCLRGGRGGGGRGAPGCVRARRRAPEQQAVLQHAALAALVQQPGALRVQRLVGPRPPGRQRHLQHVPPGAASGRGRRRHRGGPAEAQAAQLPGGGWLWV